MKTFAIALTLITLLAISGSVSATPITNDTGLADPQSIITFDEFVFADQTVITNQFESLGVTFVSMLFYNSQGPAVFPGVETNYLGNNGNALVNPFSILFTTPQTAAAFGIATNPSTTTFTAKLNGLIVESYQSATNFDDPSVSFQGFEGILFDEIEVSVGSDQALIDNIQLGSGVLLASDQSGNLFIVDTITGAGTPIGQETQFPLSTEIESDPNTGLLYSEETNGNTNLHTIDTSTGLSTGFVSHVCCALNGMEYVGTTLYATNNTGLGASTLVTVDTATGVLTPIGPLESNPIITGLAYDLNTSTMFGVTGGSGGPSMGEGPNPVLLVTVDLVTGLASPGPQLFNSADGSLLDKVGSVEFGPDGVLYGGMGLNSLLNPGWLISIDTSTGESTFVGPTGLQGITGLTLGAISGVVPMPDLAITKVDSADPVAAGANLTYTVRVDNTGTAPANDVVVTDTLPAGVTLVSTAGCAEDTAGVPTCSLGTIDAGGFAAYTITVTVNPSTTGVITNNASVTTSTQESNQDNNSTSEETTVGAEADLSITKMDSADPIISGGNQLLVYTIEVSNAGPSDATNVVVTDTLSPIALFLYTTGCLNDPTGVPDCQLGTIPTGGSASYTITVQLLRSYGTISNSASVSSDASDPTGDNNSVEETTDVEAIAIPTLDTMGLMMLLLLLAGFGWVGIRRI